MKIRISVALAAACFLLCAADASADDNAVLAKAGAGYDAREADRARCTTIIERAPNGDLPPSDHPVTLPVVTGGGVGGIAGGMMADAIIESIELAKARTRAEIVCMRNLGYVNVPLTSAEAAIYNKGSHEAFERSFLAGDLSARIAALNIPAVPKLPPYRDEPMTQGGIRIDGASLALSAPDNDGQGVILTGKAQRYRSAVLVTPIATTAGDIRVAADAGAVFHQIDNRVQREPLLRNQSATWCGPVRQISSGVESKDFYCFIGRDDGYEVFRPSGQEWYAGPYTGGFMLPRYTQPIRLEERATDDLGPLDLTLEIVDVHIHWIDLAAYVSRDGKKSRIWSRQLAFNGKGEAALDLWNQRLHFVRSEHGSHVKMTLSPDGTGESWRDEDHDPAASP